MKTKGPIGNLGKFAHPPKTNVNWSGPQKAQVAPEPKLIGKKVPPANVSKPRMRGA